jgi:hypothetical protein
MVLAASNENSDVVTNAQSIHGAGNRHGRFFFFIFLLLTSGSWLFRHQPQQQELTISRMSVHNSEDSKDDTPTAATTTSTDKGNNDETVSSSSSSRTATPPRTSTYDSDIDHADDTVLNIHIVAHSHDDVGWRKTVEQYYTGANASIDTRGNVRSIYTTVVSALLQNPARTFVAVEVKFFSMWWNEISAAMQDSVRWLIANQQLSFANGGWCMHDEAAAHYMGMVDQTTTGHAFLWKQLGVVPKIGWQLDPFGHSATQASLLTSLAGLDALYFGRIDYQDLALRQLTRQCEGLWDASSSPSAHNTTIFWGLTGSYQGNYGAPDGFCFDVHCTDESLLSANETRLLQRVDTFLQHVRVQSDQTIDNHIMVTMGTDFNVRLFYYVVCDLP